MDDKHTRMVLKLANQALTLDEIPVGAVVLDHAGKVVGKGYNLSHKHKSVLEHAEIRALRQVSKKIRDWRLNNYTLVVNLEPCLMCLGAITNARIKKVTYFLADPQFGSIESRFTKRQLQKLFPRLTIERIDDNGESHALLKKFFKKLRGKKLR